MTDRPTTTSPDPQALGVVLIAGGAGEVGASVTERVAAAGGTPVVLDLRHPAPGVDAELVDLGRPRTAEAAARRAIERHGRLDALVTLLGADAPGPLRDVTGEQWDRVLQVTLLGTAAVVRAALPALHATRGRVVTVAAGREAPAERSASSAAAFGVIGFTRALAQESAGQIGVTCVLREHAGVTVGPDAVADAVMRGLASREPVAAELVVSPSIAA